MLAYSGQIGRLVGWATIPDGKLVYLCARISNEQDPKQLSALLDELIKLLDAEQQAIKTKIAKPFSGIGPVD